MCRSRCSGATAAETYLNFEKVLARRGESGADAIHPGYGFLSENPDFAQACRDAGLTFIGPTPEAMRLLGSKTSARKSHAGGRRTGRCQACWRRWPRPSSRRRPPAISAIQSHLRPSQVAAARACVWCIDPKMIEAAFRTAASEATAAFGDGSLYVERYLERPRHVEVQILADHHGNAVHLGERECSIQRRHQKVIEESPSSVVDAELRARLGQAGVTRRWHRVTGSRDRGVPARPEWRFLFPGGQCPSSGGAPVTELVTGIDLVREQLRIAAGEPLGYGQDAIQHHGAAIECRIYAEDAANRFLPSVGTVLSARFPEGPGVRVDGALESGLEVSVYYDPLLAKLCTWGADRPQALARMRRALQELVVLGPTTNAPIASMDPESRRFCGRRGGYRAGWSGSGPSEYSEEVDATVGALTVLIEDQRAESAPAKLRTAGSRRREPLGKGGPDSGLRTR